MSKTDYGIPQGYILRRSVPLSYIASTMSHMTGSSEWMLQGPFTAAMIGTWISSMFMWRVRQFATMGMRRVDS